MGRWSCRFPAGTWHTSNTSHIWVNSELVYSASNSSACAEVSCTRAILIRLWVPRLHWKCWILSNKFCQIKHLRTQSHTRDLSVTLWLQKCASGQWLLERANHQKPGTCKLYSWRQIICTCFQATLQTHRPLEPVWLSPKANGCIYYSYSNLSVIGYWSKLLEFLGETTKRGSLKYKLPRLNLRKTGLLANLPLVLVTLWHCHRRELK